jgi:lysophospholipase L1-like esterase
MYVGDPLLHYTLNPGRFQHTQDRFRWTADVSEPDAQIICMGGSSTYGTSVSAMDSYPNRLQEELNRRGSRRYKVHNAGVASWTVPHMLSRYVHDLRHRMPKPDLILFYIGYNDMNQCVLQAETRPAHVEKFRLFPPRKPLWLKSELLFLLSCKINAAAGRQVIGNDLNAVAYDIKSPESEGVNEANLRRFRSELELLLQIMKADGTKALLVPEDTCRGQLDQRKQKALDRIRQEMRDVAAANAVPCTDMNQATQSDAAYFDDAIHLNPAGNRLAAGFLTGIIPGLLGDATAQ